MHGCRGVGAPKLNFSIKEIHLSCLSKKQEYYKFSKWCVERGWGYPIPDGYGDGTINSNPSGIGYGYGDMLRSRGKGLGFRVLV